MSWEYKVRDHLKIRKMTQAEFAESFGESQAWLSNKLNKIRATSLEDLEKIAVAMGTTVASLVSPIDLEHQVQEQPGIYSIKPLTADEYELLVHYRGLPTAAKKTTVEFVKMRLAELGD